METSQQLNVVITPDLRRQLKLKAAEQGRTMQAVVRDALERYLSGRPERQPVRERQPARLVATLDAVGPRARDGVGKATVARLGIPKAESARRAR